MVMKTFIYSVRDASGALKRGELQADSRTAAAMELKRRGLVVVELREGVAHTKGTKRETSYFSGRVVVWVAVVAVGLVAVWWRFGRGGADSSDGADRAGVRGGSSVAARAGAGSGAAAQLPHRAEPIEPIDTTVPTSPTDSMEPGAILGSGTAAQLVQEQEEVKEVVRRPFRTGTEQLLAMIRSIPPGTPMPPLPHLSGMEGDFQRAATNVLEIHEGDSEELADRIEDVAWAKQDLKELVKDGWLVEEVLEATVKEHNEKAALRYTTLKALEGLIESNSVSAEELMDELEEINKELRARELPEITLVDLGFAEEE